MRRTPSFTVYVLCAGLLCACTSAPRAPEKAAANVIGADPTINSQFREADVGVWTGRLEGESREIFRRREEIVDASGVKPGMSVADVGAGTGFITMIFARRVGPSGRVNAVDISPTFINAIAKRAAQEGLTNVSTTLGTQTDTRLPANAVDIVFTSDTYHHFENVTPVLASIRRALKPRGRFIVIDFQRVPGATSERTLSHVRAGKETVIEEVQAAGFRLLEDVTSLGLKQNYYLVFEKT
jgi:predicted methyltransferase